MRKEEMAAEIFFKMLSIQIADPAEFYHPSRSASRTASVSILISRIVV
jgi:hypothetical protein